MSVRLYQGPISLTPQNGFQVYDSTTVVEIFSGEVVFTHRATAYCKVLDRLWSDAVTGADLDRLLADSIAVLA
jgi:hypothetical protein